MEWDLGRNRRMVAAVDQASFEPPIHPTPTTPRPLKTGTQVQGGRGVKIEKFVGGYFCTMILQRVEAPDTTLWGIPRE